MSEYLHELVDRYLRGEITAEEYFDKVGGLARDAVRREVDGYRLTADEKDRALKSARSLRERLIDRMRRR